MQTIAIPDEHFRLLVRRTLLLAGLYLLILKISLSEFIVFDPDIYWHLASGKWMVEQGVIPTTDHFSQYGQGKDWVAYSWLFELLIYGLFKLFGSFGLVIYVVVFTMGITTALLLLMRKLEPDPGFLMGLTALGMFAMAPLLMTPRPWLFTILFFIIELDILLSVRRTENPRYLFMLPVLFIVWANLHIQFIYGLFVLGVFLLEPIIEACFKKPFSVKTIAASFDRKSWLILLFCILATLVNPYHVKLWGTIFDTMRQQGPYAYVTELQAMSFRSFSDWAVLGLTIGGAYLLGKTKKMRPFVVIIFLAGVFLSFRSLRDGWFIALSALMIIASSHPVPSISGRYQIPKKHIIITTLIISLFLMIWIPQKNLTNAGLAEITAKHYPKDAVNFIKSHTYSGPLYNHFDWGGFLIWQLPQLPVSVDGRTNVNGDERILRNLNTWSGHKSWADDPELAKSKLVIAALDMPLSSLLKLDKRFELVYEDAVATVFVAKSVHE
ncbi:MAG: hypothetical protein WCL60_09065 [Methylococcales bacterium]|jgi:hypothetical protein